MNELPPGWTLATADQITACERNALAIGPFGSNLKVSDYRPSGVPLVFVRNIRARAFGSADLRFVSHEKAESLRAHQVRHGDLLITKMGDPPGDVAIYPLTEPGIITADCIKLTPHPLIDVRYLLYAINAPEIQRQINEITRGVAQRKVSLDRFRKGISLPLAPLAEQDRIVAAIEEQFSRLDAGVAALEHVLVAMDRYRAAILGSAVHGRLSAGWRKQNPGIEPAEQLIERIQTERSIRSSGSAKPSAMIGSELPKGWCWSTTGSICECIVPNRDKPKSFTGDTPWITLPDFGIDIELHSSRSGLGLSQEEIERSRAKVIPRGSVVMSCIGRFGISAVLGRDAVINQQLHAFLVPSGMNARYLAYAIQTQSNYMKSIATSTTIPYLNKTNCNRVPIPVPPSLEQEHIVTEIERRLSVAEQVRQQVITELRRGELLRSAILAAAFSGRLVSQDPDDEPASALLERIAAGRSSSNSRGPARVRKPSASRDKVTA